MSRLLAQRSACGRAKGFPSTCRYISQDSSSVSSPQPKTKGHASRGRQQTMNPGLKPILERVNSVNKTITTPVGDLPISPLMDPVYHETRTRWTKPKAPQRTVFEKQKWRRHLERSPWALALATPIRRCPGTSICLPKFFLQDFNIVLHPETEQPWFVPTSLVAPQQGQQQGTESTPQEAKISSKPGPPKKPAGPAAYMVARQDYLAQQTQNGELHRMEYKKLMALHHSSDRIKSIANRAIWREDMESLVLRLMRRRVLEDLIYLSTLSADPTRDPYVVRCQTWDDVKDDKYRGQRGCVLWLGPEGEAGGPGPRATMDIPGVKYGRKIVVHNLWRLLGEEGVARLRESVELFREGEVFLVLRKRTVEMQMKLWKLQGFLAHPFVSYLDPATGNPREKVEVGNEDEGEAEKEWEEEVGMENEEEEYDMAEDDVDEDNGDWEKQIQALRRMEAEEPRGRARSSF